MKEIGLGLRENIWEAMENYRIMAAQVHNNVPPGQQAEEQDVGCPRYIR